MRSQQILSTVLACLVVLAGTTAAAQTPVQIPLQLDFVNPGAKSLALAGAFAGMADDATAGFANPAGLRELSRPEFSVELRGRWLETAFLQRGRLSGTLLNEGTDVIAGPVFGQSPDNSLRLSYLSAVVPFPRQRWVIAGFRHELARVDQSFFSEGVFQQDPTEFTSRRDSPQEVVRQIAITNYGVAAAVEINPRVAVGGTLSIYTFDLFSKVRRFDTVGFLGPAVLTREFGLSTQQGTDVALGSGVGVRACLKACDDRATTAARFGFVYRRGPTFDYETQDGPDVRSSRFRVPDTFAAGGALEIPGDGKRLLLAGEVTRITYSRLRRDFVSEQAISTGIQDFVTLNDGTEIHAGAQYTVETAAWLPRFRGGIWYDPDHSVKYIPPPPTTLVAARLLDEKMSVALSTGRNRVHYTGGVGLTFSPGIEWNFGADLASHAKVISTSVIVKLR